MVINGNYGRLTYSTELAENTNQGVISCWTYEVISLLSISINQNRHQLNWNSEECLYIRMFVGPTQTCFWKTRKQLFAIHLMTNGLTSKSNKAKSRGQKMGQNAPTPFQAVAKPNWQTNVQWTRFPGKQTAEKGRRLAKNTNCTINWWQKQ